MRMSSTAARPREVVALEKVGRTRIVLDLPAHGLQKLALALAKRIIVVDKPHERRPDHPRFAIFSLFIHLHGFPAFGVLSCRACRVDLDRGPHAAPRVLPRSRGVTTVTVSVPPADRESESKAFRNLTVGLAVEHLAGKTFGAGVEFFEDLRRENGPRILDRDAPPAVRDPHELDPDGNLGAR